MGTEDTALVERVQRGLGSGLLEGGVLLPESERLIAHFDRLVAERAPIGRGGRDGHPQPSRLLCSPPGAGAR